MAKDIHYPVLEKCESGDTGCLQRNQTAVTNFITNILNQYRNDLYAALNTAFTNLQTSMLQNIHTKINTAIEGLNAAHNVLVSNTQDAIALINSLEGKLSQTEISLRSAITSGIAVINSNVDNTRFTLTDLIDQLPSRIKSELTNVETTIGSSLSVIKDSIINQILKSENTITKHIDDVTYNLTNYLNTINNNISNNTSIIIQHVSDNGNRVTNIISKSTNDIRADIKQSTETFNIAQEAAFNNNKMLLYEIVNDIKQFIIEQFTTTPESLADEMIKHMKAQSVVNNTIQNNNVG